MKEDNLLYLLKLGLGLNKVRPVSFSKEEWLELFSLAKEQTVLGIVFSAMEKLPKEALPSQELLLVWIGMAETLKQRNKAVDKTMCMLVGELRQEGIEPIIVKGQIVAREYERPELRSSGDIDVFVTKEQWCALECWLQRNGYDITCHSAEKHIEIIYKDTTVEFHHHLNVFSSKAANDCWAKSIEDTAMDNSRELSFHLVAPTAQDSSYSVRTLGVTESLLHLMVHIHHHLLTEGIGLRQLIDYSLFLRNHFNELDLLKLRGHLHGIGHEKAFNIYCALANKYLGLKPQFIPFELDLCDYVYADKIMDEVWRGGNFGHKNNLPGVKPGLLHSANTALLVLKHSWKFYRLAPEEARGYWLNKIFWRWQRETHAKRTICQVTNDSQYERQTLQSFGASMS